MTADQTLARIDAELEAWESGPDAMTWNAERGAHRPNEPEPWEDSMLVSERRIAFVLGEVNHELLDRLLMASRVPQISPETRDAMAESVASACGVPADLVPRRLADWGPAHVHHRGGHP